MTQIDGRNGKSCWYCCRKFKKIDLNLIPFHEHTDPIYLCGRCSRGFLKQKKFEYFFNYLSDSLMEISLAFEVSIGAYTKAIDDIKLNWIPK